MLSLVSLNMLVIFLIFGLVCERGPLLIFGLIRYVTILWACHFCLEFVYELNGEIVVAGYCMFDHSIFWLDFVRGSEIILLIRYLYAASFCSNGWLE